MNETTNGLPTIGFSYSDVSPELADECRERARRIRTNIDIRNKSGVEIGLDLMQMKEKLGHGQFGGWIELEFDMSVRSAQVIMGIAKTFKNAESAFLNFPRQVLLELSHAPDPQEALEEANERKESGETLTAKQAKEIAELQRQVADAFKSAQPEPEPQLESDQP
jgi:hypothetical protein